MSVGQEVLARRFRRQAGWCAGEGEVLYADLLERAAADVEAGGPSWTVLEPFAPEPGENAVPLRFLAGIHRLVLSGEAPVLARHFPSAGGTAGIEGAWEACREVLEEKLEELRALAARPCQTNEVGRSAALLMGFLAVARATGRRLRLLEVGTSGGLNLRFDRYWYGSWGDPESPVRMEGMYASGEPSTPRRVTVTERAGCDLRPVDPTSEEGALTLMAFTWPSNPIRMERLRGAVEVARRVPADIEQADAVEWLAERLRRPRSRAATVVFHSIFLQYLPDARRQALVKLIEHGAAGAVADAPLAWVRMEPGDSAFEVRCRLWPGGRDVLVGTCGPHGAGFRAA